MVRTLLPRRSLLLLICYVGFVSLGLPDALLGVAWPSIRRTFDLQQSAISWIFFGSGCTYFVSSFFTGRLLKILNVGVLLAASTATVALSGFDYSLSRIWPLFAAGALLHGLGSGAIDSALNHYVANHFSARHMNWLHACYSLGAMLGPLLMTGMIAWAGSWRLGYMVVAGTLLALSLLFIATKAQWNDADRIGAAASTEIKPARSITATEALRIKAVWLHIILFFVYTGLEISLGQWSFTVLTESRNIGVSSAGVWVTIYWASILAGRILFGFVVDRVGIDTLIRLSLMAALIGTALFAWNPWPWSSPVALGLAGLGLAVIYPSLMTRTPERFGKQVALHAIGFQVAAAMLGGAVLPGMTGFIAQHTGLHVVAGTLCLTAAFLFALHEFVLFKTAGLANRLITYLG